MTVAELIEELRKYPPDSVVGMWVDDVRYHIETVEDSALPWNKVVNLVAER